MRQMVLLFLSHFLSFKAMPWTASSITSRNTRTRSRSRWCRPGLNTTDSDRRTRPRLPGDPQTVSLRV